MQWEVETDLIVHLRVRVTVDADDKAAAIDAAADLLPGNYDPDSKHGWGANVMLKAPKGVNIRVVKAVHFEQASGGEKARKLATA